MCFVLVLNNNINAFETRDKFIFCFLVAEQINLSEECFNFRELIAILSHDFPFIHRISDLQVSVHLSIRSRILAFVSSLLIEDALLLISPLDVNASLLLIELVAVELDELAEHLPCILLGLQLLVVDE